MSQYDTTNKGALFEGKQRGDRHPDYTGHVTPRCPHCQKTTEFWLSAWWKETRVGTMLSLALTVKEDRKVPAPVVEKRPVPVVAGCNDDFDDDIPF